MTYDGDGNEQPHAMPGEEDLLGAEMRALLSSLPRELPPERDLTDSIASRTWDSRERLPGGDSEPGRAATPGGMRFVRTWWSGQGLKLAAAAAAIILVTAAVTTAIVRDSMAPDTGAEATVVETSDTGGAMFAGYADVEMQYAAAIADLSSAVEAERDQLPPETVALIEENLRVIDEAIRESLAALRSSPQSLPLQQAVMTSYERKLDFLRQAAAVTAEG